MSLSNLKERFHSAARDGYLDLFKDSTKKDCNAPDEDGMTPTLWAAFSGNLDALRIIVGRGGDPGKCDNLGNSALHHAAANGHINCVSFLVSFGVNLWVLDNQFHTAKDLAAMNNREEVIKFLDEVIAKQSALNTKTVQKMKEKAIIDAEKRVKSSQKLQKKVLKKAEREEKLIEKQKKKLYESNNEMNGQNRIQTSYPSMCKESQGNYASLKFSDIVNSNHHSNGTTTSRLKVLGVVSRKVQLKKQQSDSLNSSNDFKVRDTLADDGTKSLRSLSGIKRDNQILYVPKYEDEMQLNLNGSRLHMKDVFDSKSIDRKQLYRATSEPDFMCHPMDALSDPSSGDLNLSHGKIEPHEFTSSIFERPGFGSVAFRGSIFSMPYNEEKADSKSNQQSGSSGHADSIGSAGSLARRNVRNNCIWEENESDDCITTDSVSSCSFLFFLYAHGLSEYLPLFTKEKIDFESLLLLNEDDLKCLGLPLGPRKKLLKVIHDRTNTIQNPGEIKDSKL